MILVDNGSFISIDDVKKIEIIFKKSKNFPKKSVIVDSEFPRFNTNHLIEKYEVVLKSEDDAV